METKPVKLNATLYWVNNIEPNELSGKFQFDAGRLSPAAVNALKSLGLEVKEATKEGDERGHYITIKSNRPYRFTDERGMTVNPEVKIGNGSKAILIVSAYEWKFKNKSGLSPTLVKAQFTELIEYDGASTVDPDGAL